MTSDATTPGRGGKFLTFALDDEVYGLEILRVQEIIGLMKITAVPRSSDYLKGVINLRGRVIPVIDLRLKFGLAAIEPTAMTCIVVVHARGVETGLIVDNVADVCELRDDEVSPAPELGSGIREELLLGLGRTDDGVTILLDIERVLTIDDVVELRQLEPSA